MIKYLKSFFSLIILITIGLTINGSFVPVFDSRSSDRHYDRPSFCNNSSKDFDTHEVSGISKNNSFDQDRGQGIVFADLSKQDRSGDRSGDSGYQAFQPSVFKDHRPDDLGRYVREPVSSDLITQDIDVAVDRPFAGQPVEIPLLIQEMQKNSALNQQLAAFNKAELTMLELIVKNGSVEALLDLEELVFEFDRDLYDKGSVGNLAASSLGAVFNRQLSKLVKQIQQVAYDKKGTIRELNYERRQQIAWIVSSYLKEKYPHAYIEILRHYVDNHVIEFISILNLEEDMGFGGKFARVWHDKFMHKNASVNIPSVIHNNEVHKGLLILKNLYLNGDIIGAQKFYSGLRCKQTSSEVQAIVDKFWIDLLKHDLQLYQDNKFYPYHDDRLAKLFPTEQDQRKDFLQQSAEPFICHDMKYELNQSTREVLYDLKIDERRFTKFQGNQEQSVKNAILICVLNNAVEKMMETSVPEHKACWLSLIQSAAVIQGFNEEATFKQFPEVLTEYLQLNPAASINFCLRFTVELGNDVKAPVTISIERAEDLVKVGSLILRTALFINRNDGEVQSHATRGALFVERIWELGLSGEMISSERSGFESESTKSYHGFVENILKQDRVSSDSKESLFVPSVDFSRSVEDVKLQMNIVQGMADAFHALQTAADDKKEGFQKSLRGFYAAFVAAQAGDVEHAQVLAVEARSRLFEEAYGDLDDELMSLESDQSKIVAPFNEIEVSRDFGELYSMIQDPHFTQLALLYSGRNLSPHEKTAPSFAVVEQQLLKDGGIYADLADALSSFEVWRQSIDDEVVCKAIIAVYEKMGISHDFLPSGEVKNDATRFQELFDQIATAAKSKDLISLQKNMHELLQLKVFDERRNGTIARLLSRFTTKITHVDRYIKGVFLGLGNASLFLLEAAVTLDTFDLDSMTCGSDEQRIECCIKNMERFSKLANDISEMDSTQVQWALADVLTDAGMGAIFSKLAGMSVDTAKYVSEIAIERSQLRFDQAKKFFMNRQIQTPATIAQTILRKAELGLGVTEVEFITPEGIKIKVPVSKDSGLEFAKHQQNVPKGAANKSVKPVSKVVDSQPKIPKIEPMPMHVFLEDTEFGRILKKNTLETNYKIKGERVYEVVNKLKEYGLKKGEFVYMDSFHLDHLEVFTKNRESKFVLNLDGSTNLEKTNKALSRSIKRYF